MEGYKPDPKGGWNEVFKSSDSEDPVKDVEQAIGEGCYYVTVEMQEPRESGEPPIDLSVAPSAPETETVLSPSESSKHSGGGNRFVVLGLKPNLRRRGIRRGMTLAFASFNSTEPGKDTERALLGGCHEVILELTERRKNQ